MKTITKKIRAERHEAAMKRAEARAGRKPESQIKKLQKKPGNSEKEITRLRAIIRVQKMTEKQAA